MRKPSKIIAAKLDETGSTRPLGLFRICLGALLYMRFGQELSIHAVNSVPEMAFAVAYFACAAGVFLGLFTRASLLGAAGLLAAMYFGESFGWYYPGWAHHHHYVLMACCFLTALGPSGRSFSLDRVLALRAADRAGAEAPEERGPTFAQTLLVLQLCTVYFWTAVDKTQPGYMAGDWLERIMEWVASGHPAYDIATNRVFLIAGSWAVLIVEWVLPFAILLRWRLNWIIPIGLALHAAFYVLLPVFTYSATMMALYLLVVDPDWLDAQMDEYVFGKPQTV